MPGTVSHNRTNGVYIKKYPKRSRRFCGCRDGKFIRRRLVQRMNQPDQLAQRRLCPSHQRLVLYTADTSYGQLLTTMQSQYLSVHMARFRLTWSIQILWNRCSHLTSFLASSSASKSHRQTKQRASVARLIVSAPSTASATSMPSTLCILNSPGADATSSSLATGGFAGPSIDESSIMSS
jgi:hypothetical protein